MIIKYPVSVREVTEDTEFYDEGIVEFAIHGADGGYVYSTLWGFKDREGYEKIASFLNERKPQDISDLY